MKNFYTSQTFVKVYSVVYCLCCLPATLIQRFVYHFHFMVNERIKIFFLDFLYLFGNRRSILLSTISLCVFSPQFIFAQSSVKFIGTSSGPSTSGPTTTQQAITFYKDASTPSTPPITATFSYSNQQFSQTEGNPTVPGMTFGTVSQFLSSSNPANNTAGSSPTYDLMNVISGPSNSNFTACSACGTGTGIDVTTNRAVALFNSTDAFIDGAGNSTIPFTARTYMGDLTITFSQPVNNPMLHVVGLGGFYNYFTEVPKGSGSFVYYNIGFTTELDLVTSGIALSKKSGNSPLLVSATSIQNGATQYGPATSATVVTGVTRQAATGTIVIEGFGITTVTFKLYLKGDGGTIRDGSGNPTSATLGNKIQWSSQLNHNPAGISEFLNAFNGDKYLIGLSLQPCQQIINPSSDQTVCVGNAGNNITVQTDINTANSIRFVKFNTDQMAGAKPTATEANAIYAGTAISTVTPSGGSNPYTATYNWNSSDFSTPGTYYVYAILGGVIEGDCHPVQEIKVVVLPKPTFTTAVTSPTCSGAIANNNGKITLTNVQNSDKYFINVGNTSSGTYSSATTIPPVGTDIQTSIPNSGGTYTVRFYNGDNTCFKDTTITVLPKVCLPVCCTGTNIITNSSFENGTFTANSSVVDPNNANSVNSSSTIITDWQRDSNIKWVSDGNRSTDGNKFMYLPTQIKCVTRDFTLGNDVSICKTYKVCFDVAAFDDTQPNGGTSTSGVVLEGTFFNSDATRQQAAFKIVDFTEVSTNAPLANPMTISSWNNIRWKRVTATFTIPPTTLVNASNFKLYFSNAINKYVQSDGKGILLDNVCLSEVPTSATICDAPVKTIRVSTNPSGINTPDSEGRIFEPYTVYNLNGSNPTPTSATILNTGTGAPNGTSFQALYRSSLAGNLLDWHFTVPNGNYTVLLHFAETVPTNNAAGKRLFDISLEGNKVETNFDIFTEAASSGNSGAINRAIVRPYTVKVIDNDLQLILEKTASSPDVATISGIEILPAFCKTTQSVKINKVTTSDCFLNTNNQSKATVSVEVSWENALSTDSIKVAVGTQTRWINPGYVGTMQSVLSPQTVTFEVDANGTNGTVIANFPDNSDCETTSTFQTPAFCGICTPVITNIVATAATCKNGVAEKNATITFDTSNGDKYDIVQGASYSGGGYATAKTIFVTKGSLTGIANPATATTYTIRVFNGNDNCFTDVTVTLNPVTCISPCGSPNCGTVTVIKN
jgi:Malectin domain